MQWRYRHRDALLIFSCRNDFDLWHLLHPKSIPYQGASRSLRVPNLVTQNSVVFKSSCGNTIVKWLVEAVWPRGSADKSQDHSRALRACIWHSPRTGSGVQVVRDIPGWERWRQTCVRSTSVLHQGSRRHRTELGPTYRALTGTATSPTSSEWWWWWQRTTPSARMGW